MRAPLSLCLFPLTLHASIPAIITRLPRFLQHPLNFARQQALAVYERRQQGLDSR
jgi:hypothetical protein